MTEQTFIEKLASVQNDLKAPKAKKGKAPYASRNAEQILGQAKPLLLPLGLIVILEDTILLVGDKYFVQSKATVTDGKEQASATGVAELVPPSSMVNQAQASGSTTSYARKFALQGVFGIGEEEDADHEKYIPSESSYEPSPAKNASAKQVGFAESLLSKSDKDVARSWFKDHFGNKPLSELTSKECSEFIEYLNNKPAGTIDDVSQYSDEVF